MKDGLFRKILVSFTSAWVLVATGCLFSSRGGSERPVEILSLSPEPGSDIFLKDTLWICFSGDIKAVGDRIYEYNGSMSMMYLEPDVFPGTFMPMESRWDKSTRCVGLRFVPVSDIPMPTGLVLTIDNRKLLDGGNKPIAYGKYGDGVQSVADIHFRLVAGP